MRGLIVYVTALLLTGDAKAAECNVFTHEARAPGETVAVLSEDGWRLRIMDQRSGETTYDLRSGGTGISALDGTPVAGSGSTDHIPVMEHKGDLIIDMMIFVPYCGPSQSEKTIRLPIIPKSETAAGPSP